MDSVLLSELAEKYLVPLFSGAKLSNQVASNAKQGCVAFVDPCTILFKALRTDTYRLPLRRSQAFDKIASGRVTEKDVVQAFIDVVQEIEPGLSASYRADLLSTFQRRVVVKAIVDANAQAALLEGIDQLALWATRLYEGKPIVAAFGFMPDGDGGTVTLHEICQKDFSAVLSNGFDTLLSFDFQGKVVGHESLSQAAIASSFAPFRQAPIAEWAKDGRIAVVLNRLGEILAFKDQKLLFARRSGKWHFLTHEPVLTQMRRPQDNAVRCAVYESCLDASFARTGACVGIVVSAHLLKWKQVSTSSDDHLDNPTSAKAKSISRMVNGRTFQKIDRRLRQELLAIDGATLLDHKGKVLAVGAILKIPGGSTGGGRLAAAKELGKLGLGIKVSQDGRILGFQDGSDDPKFAVM